ncbi:Cytosine deaminase [Wickerhamiella sorbophila]|uniref:Cytosine deaminase n=1 Tax=Wickerhamiella sorbophila TaxID=45607 RepID=A0A2T0FHQ7_9ASCO|nr:Cytosine deaminase [Wickerhamiella sorbophila]PRT54524.1 Cytosine deaminase [Wickerhamiella sorbophila]
MSEQDQHFLNLAIEEAKKGVSEGGIPIGAVLVSKDGKVLGSGHNKRVQQGSTVLHGEMDALENAGRLPGSAYKGATMYTTLSPCDMCSGACLLYGVSRVVLGENETFQGNEQYLQSRGVEVVNLNSADCKKLMADFIAEKPQLWNEDIGI